MRVHMMLLRRAIGDTLPPLMRVDGVIVARERHCYAIRRLLRRQLSAALLMVRYYCCHALRVCARCRLLR